MGDEPHEDLDEPRTAATHRPLAGRLATRWWHALRRAGGGGSARRPAGPRPERSPRWPAASTASRSPTRSATRAARPTETARAGRTRPATHRRLAALDPRPRQQRPVQVFRLQPAADRDRLLVARHHADLRRRLPRLPRPQPLRPQRREGDPHPCQASVIAFDAMSCSRYERSLSTVVIPPARARRAESLGVCGMAAGVVLAFRVRGDTIAFDATRDRAHDPPPGRH